MKPAEIYTHTHTHTHTNKLLPCFLTAFLVTLSNFPTYANDELDNALRATYMACVGIDNELQHLKTMAGINTAVTSVGVAAGAGATATGFIKSNLDSKIQEWEQILDEFAEKQNLTSLTEINVSDAELAKLASDVQKMETAKSVIDQAKEKSKQLGNWRTGLIAGNTATNIAGAVIAGTNQVDKELQQQIDDCRAAVSNLRNAMMQARVDGDDVSEAETITRACGEYDYVDVSKINKRARGAMISSVVGATTGAVGTITSAVANTNKVRNDNSDAGRNKENTLNTTANVMSIGATASSVSATVFNAAQISAIKNVAAVSEKCTEVLK